MGNTSDKPALVSISDAAATRIKQLMDRGTEQGGEPVLGLRVGVTTKGCSGMSYKFSYAHDIKPMEDVVEVDGAKVIIEPMAVMYILGAEIDWIEDRLESKFVFNNPNEKGRCGCGESFHV